MLHGECATETTNCDADGDSFSMSFIWNETAVHTKDLKPCNRIIKLDVRVRRKRIKITDLRTLRPRKREREREREGNLGEVDQRNEPEEGSPEGGSHPRRPPDAHLGRPPQPPSARTSTKAALSPAVNQMKCQRKGAGARDEKIRSGDLVPLLLLICFESES
ncbi:hypothetical protein BHE74_00023383 [Ensete ventricosum]|nr:hypothetical protein BHE74_00023383 [Ensete ventricosum]